MKLYQTLESQLKKEPNYVSDNGELKKWVVIDKAQNFDEELIELLLKEPTVKSFFFKEIAGITVFNQSLFLQFLEQKNFLNDSYTQFKNKIGLTIDGKYLKQRNEVALVWPFKDCVLEGGQSREEDKREEIFFNEILAQDEITQLLEPKVLTNAKHIDKEGENSLRKFNRDAELNKNRGLPEDTITDNLIIKGNNLLALHSLKKEFTGKVKLIYIDPPYNTGNDGFKYNDNFNHSTWLTFMKNRLQVARELLKDDGSIFISCDDNEQAYLKIILDEVFGRGNFVTNFVWRRRKTQANLAKNIAPVHDFIICVAKNKSVLNINKVPYSEDFIKKSFSNPDNDERGLYQTGPLARPANSSNKEYVLTMPNGREIKAKWSCSQQTFDRYVKEDRLVIPRGGEGMPRIKIFLSELEGQIPNTWLDNIATNDEASKEIERFFGTNAAFSFAKPTKLIKHIIQIGSDKNDIVLDFFGGSGTTAHAVLELNKEDGGNRQFILSEQMDYIETVTTKRVQKVIEQNESGSFVYLELKKYNQIFIEQIQEAKNTEELLKIWEQMKVKSFLNYNVDIQKQEEHIEEFKTLTLAEQKQHLVDILDKNQLYVNLSALDDKDFACTEEEKKVAQDFYGRK
ncbi:MAG: site-specific DNA-methyltransferase [Flavobacteriaceae bacterium]|jgi:adenine-specific DNA-methyltransferase|nr:site-specific DNA-methyltransferase [Flavobacteriaceae bacterium]